MRRFFPFAALLGVALVLGCQDLGTGPDGLVPQFTHKDGAEHGKGKGGGGGGGGKPSVPIVNVTVAGGVTASEQDMELVRKGDIVKLRATATKKLPAGGLSLAMTMDVTHAAGIGNDGKLRFNNDPLLHIYKGNGDRLCERTGPDLPPEANVRTLFDKLVQNPAALRDVIVTIDKTALGEPENHQIKIFPDITVTGLNIVGDINNTDNFAVTASGEIRLAVSPKRPYHFHLICDIQSGDEITFTVTSQ